jgi:hypothetical protein
MRDFGFEFQKCAELFIRLHNETLSIERFELLGIFHA